ncbi:glutamate--cysteine ligase [Parashewanella spongiae]|uniref:Glutamate--cysteine ligase n=1 Tax=Parashewanella spongiae TaxID=342950 RepID=A0A3A6T3J9_9GAMM|nr:glutamate--cysteine ligase [Parashewanella spongiae]MCL1080228.1 glutamate--cysteine ligase [Parashewanella spongiae]RJY02154.1 glutamate--cysteine ligase [Parashewanella spongiae]
MKPFSQSLAFLANENGRHALLGMQRGIERETLRIDADSHLASDEHPKALGSALTHSRITTDYSESLLEFITPVYNKIPELLADLTKTHAYTVRNLNGQYLWPVSMPCFVNDVGSIPIAQYGTSNIGKMKTLYRKGLTARYGAQMQVISGVHFNFSVSQELWELLYSQSDKALSLDDFISDSYFGLIRNYRRNMWVLPYLFGASPALCGSFLDGLDVDLPFQKTGKGTLYLPYATSLRMSDLGYTNKEQDTLGVSYNSLPDYLDGMKKAIKMKSQKFADIGVKVNGEYRQLNDNILQIENEFYSPIRPKRVANENEKPSEALARSGVQYVEVRALDNNPFNPVGISASQVRFLDLFLLHCLLSPSKKNSQKENQEITSNLNSVILEGRKPGLTLKRENNPLLLQEWLTDLFKELSAIASIIDDDSCTEYQTSLDLWYEAVLNPDKTLSGRMLNQFVGPNIDHGRWAMELANHYQAFLKEYVLSETDLADYQQQTDNSLAALSEIEANSTQSFDGFLNDYFDDVISK